MKKLCALGLLFFMMYSSAYAGSFIGVRGAIGEGNTEEEFEAYEGFLVFDLPWAWEQSPTSRIQTQLEVTGGVLDGGGVSGFLGTLGPRLAFITERVSVDVGIGVAALGETQFGAQDFRGKSQYIAQVGLAFGLTQRVNAGVRWRHMSDAKTHGNGGELNLVLLELSYDFHES